MKEQLPPFISQEKYTQNKGLSIPEVLLVLVVFLITFIGFYNLIFSYIRNLQSASDRIVANFLAQEGLELVRAIRNYRWGINYCRNIVSTTDSSIIYPYCPEYTTSTWLSELVDNQSNSFLCINYDFSTSTCNNFDDPNSILYLNNSNFFTSNISNATPTKFKRIVTITTADLYQNVPIESATSVKVISEVKWNEYSIKLEGIIFNFSKVQP
ncbi:MAG: hypothetical protein NZ866_02530 [Patescibacteria group bacterium]|nr:hypothetical protein [Patescibacteria group bacterium]